MKNTEPYREERPWGSFTQFTHNEQTTVKILSVKPGEQLSVQYHKNRSEFWYIVGGNGTIIIDEKEIPAVPGEYHVVPKGAVHSIRGGEEQLQILEIAYGDFDENDIVRISDKYNRAP